ncbi:MAG: NapC/NirT family cytochrome c [Blastocatellia bacterium]
MISPTVILIATILVSITLAGLVAFRPSVTSSRGGKILAFVSIFLFPVLAASMGVDQHVERSKTTAFCTSCHVMGNYGKSLRVDDASYLPAAHFQNNRVPRDNACYTCHTDYTMYGGFKSKLRGVKHLYVQYLGKIPAKVELYNAYNNRECLHCHSGARSFEEGTTHNLEEGRLDSIKSNGLSCLSTGCHEVVHNVGGLGDAKFWSEIANEKNEGGSQK